MDSKELNYNRTTNQKGALIGNWYEETVLKTTNHSETFDRTMFNMYGRNFQTVNGEYGKAKENAYAGKREPRKQMLTDLYLKHCEKHVKY